MKKFYFIIAVMFTITFVSCGKLNPDNHDGTDNVVRVNVKGTMTHIIFPDYFGTQKYEYDADLSKYLDKYKNNTCTELRLTGKSITLSRENAKIIEKVFPNIKILFFKDFVRSSIDSPFYFGNNTLEEIYFIGEKFCYLRGLSFTDGKTSNVKKIYIKQAIDSFEMFEDYFYNTVFYIYKDLKVNYGTGILTYEDFKNYPIGKERQPWDGKYPY